MTVPSSPLHRLGARLRLGRALYLLWHRPRAALARSRREGGPWEQWVDRRARREMERAAFRLPPRPPPSADAPEVAFLTGRRFWFQTAFCCWSLCRHTGDRVMPRFVDDGTFDAALEREIRRVFPTAQLDTRATIEARLSAHLPAARFPALRRQRESYIHLRKLTDVHAGRSGWRAVLDSDMLFFRPPAALLAWLSAPDLPLHLRDVQDAYGYPASTLGALVGTSVPSCINVGVTGLRSDTIPWDELETWCAALLATHGTSYYLEQALIALLLSRQSTVGLSSTDYRVMPAAAECARPTAVLHHYVDLSKRGYFRHAWRHVVADLPDAL